MGNDVPGRALFVVLLLTSLGVALVVMQDLSHRPRSRTRNVVACCALALVSAGMSLTISPYSASTGAVCTTSPTTNVLGPDGSRDRLAEAPDAVDRASTDSCISAAQTRTAVAVVLVLLGSAGYAVVRRPRVHEPLLV